MVRRRQIIRYGISLGIDTTDMARGAREANTVTRRLNRDIGRTDATLRKYKHAQMQLRHEFKAGKITKEQYLTQLKKERLLRDRANGSIAKYRANQRRLAEERKRETMELRRQEVALRRLASQREREARAAAAARARHAQMLGGAGAGGLSMFGFGGAAAGGARMMGNMGADGLLAGGAGAGVVAGGAALLGGMAMGRYINNAIDEFGQLEGKLVDLKVLYGEIKGEQLGKEFKQLANSTALTTNQLIGNAKIWASYGLTTDGIVDRMRRLGEVTGGQTEKFQALTVAFAQVNAQGKLMGQEKNQLINAGFSLAEVAKVAGIEMTDFAKAMEEGRITADHLNQALINMTSEGGLYEGLLEEKAKTLEGQAIIVKSKWEETNQAIGENWAGWRKLYNDASIAFAEWVKQQEEWANSTSGERWYSVANLIDPSNQQFGIKNTRGGKWGGSYSAEGIMKTGTYGSGIRANDNRMSMFQEIITGLFGYGGAVQSGIEADVSRQGLVSGLPQEWLQGTEGGWRKVDKEEQERQKRNKEKAEKERREAAIKRREEARKLAEDQSNNYAKMMRRWKFADPSTGGFNAMTRAGQVHDLNKALADKKITYDQYTKLYNIMQTYFARQAEADRKKEFERKKEAREKKLRGYMQYGQYENQGLTPEAIAYLKKRDKMMQEAGESFSGKGGGSDVAGGNTYSLAAERKKEVMDRQRAIKIAEKQERHQSRIRQNTNRHIQQMDQQNRFFENNIGSV